MFCYCFIFLSNDSFFLSNDRDLETRNNGGDEVEAEVSLRQCPSGVHVSDVVLIQKCACLISEDEHEKYEACLNSAR